jgi:hypothetical protein
MVAIPEYMTDEQLLVLFVFWLAVCYHPHDADGGR